MIVGRDSRLFGDATRALDAGTLPDTIEVCKAMLAARDDHKHSCLARTCSNASALPPRPFDMLEANALVDV